MAPKQNNVGRAVDNIARTISRVRGHGTINMDGSHRRLEPYATNLHFNSDFQAGMSSNVNILLRTGGSGGSARYFYMNQSIRRGQDFDQFIDKILKLVKTGSYGDRFADDDEVDVMKIRVLPSYRGRDLDDFVSGDSDLDAYHSFQRSTFENKFSMGKLIMRDFPCIYESLAMIRYVKEHGQPKFLQRNGWVSYVTMAFAKEHVEFQNACYEGRLSLCLELFEREYGIKIGIYNCYKGQQEIDSMKISLATGEDIPEYYLIYWGEHVFPASARILVDICAYIGEFMEEESTAVKAYCIIPEIFKVLYNEIRYYAVCSEEEQKNDLWIFKELQGQINYADVRLAGQYYKGRKKETVQLQYIREKKFLGQQSDRDVIGEVLQFTREQLNTNTNKPGFIKSLQEQVQKDRRLQPIFTTLQQEHIVKKIIARRKQFDEIGLCGLDLEACIDNSLSESTYTLRVYMGSLYGRLQQINMIDGVLKTTVVQVNQVFHGLGVYDCVSKMIDWLIENRHIWMDYDSQSMQYPKGSDNSPNLYNYIIAHNGFGFDYRYMYEKLLERSREFKMIGDVTNTKCLMGAGLYLYDFSLIYKEKLSVLAKTFFGEQSDLLKYECDDVVGLPVETVKEWFALREQGQVVERYEDLIKYNIQDSRIVYELAQKFFRFTFTTPFGHSMLPKMFYHSLSSLSWDMWATCFLKTPLFINRKTQSAEQTMNIGGFTMAYRSQVDMGIIIDVNSFYPSIMMNRMPVQHVSYAADSSITKFEMTIIANRENYRNLIAVHDIYKIKFRYPKETKLPTIVQRTGETIVMVLESSDYDLDNDQEGVWVFGETVRVAIECADAEIKIFSCIRFIPEHLHKDYIEFHYKKRLEAKAAGDKVGDIFHKNMMNSLFGKHGQKLFKQNVFGGWSYVRDQYQQLLMRKDVHDVEINQIMSDRVPIYEMKYQLKDADMNHKGATMRISAFIMEMARSYLMRIKHAIADVLGWESISYCDTDSVMISFDKAEPSKANLLQQLYANYQRDLPVRRGDQQWQKEQTDIMKSIITECASYKKVAQIMIKDVRNLDSDQKVPLIDDSRLGACKIEKEIICAKFTGQKQYGMTYIENGMIKEAVKVKGVPKKHATKEMIDQLAFQDGVNGIPVFQTSHEVFRRLGAGTSIQQIQHIVRPTLYKRQHDLNTRLSAPFRTVQEQIDYKAIYNNKMFSYKEQFKQDLREMFGEAMKDAGALAVQEAVKKHGEKARSLKQQMLYENERLCESRKRFLIRLPKLKYDCLQDKMLHLLYNDRDCIGTAYQYLSKCISIAYKAIIHKKQQTKKSVGAWLLDDDDKYSKGSLDNDQCSRVVAFCLFIHFVAMKKELPITNQFESICKALSLIMRECIDNVAPVSRSESNWRQALVHGMQFLIAPVTLVNPDNAPLDEKIKVTSLWRFMSNLMIQQVSMQGDEVVVDDTKQMMDKLINGPMMKNTYRNGKYDYVLEAKMSNEDVQQIISKYHRMQKVQSLKDDELENIVCSENEPLEEVEEQLKYNPYEEPVLISTEEKKDDKKEVDYKRRQLAAMLLSERYVVDGQLEQNSFTMSEVLFQNPALRAKTTDEGELNYYAVFGINGGSKVKATTQKDVVDYCLFYQLLFFGGIGAVKIIKDMIQSWKKIVGSREQNGIMQLIEVMQIIFQKPRLFGDTTGPAKQNMPKAVKDLFIYLSDHVILFNWEPENTDQHVQHKLTDMLGQKFISADLKALFKQSVNEGPAKQVGLKIINKILKWLNPTPEMKNHLEQILLMKAASTFDTTGFDKSKIDTLMASLVAGVEDQGQAYIRNIKNRSSSQSFDIEYQKIIDSPELKESIAAARSLITPQDEKRQLAKIRKKMTFFDEVSISDNEYDMSFASNLGENFIPDYRRERLFQQIEEINEQEYVIQDEEDMRYVGQKRFRDQMYGYNEQEDSLIMGMMQKRQDDYFKHTKGIFDLEADESDNDKLSIGQYFN